VTTARAPHLLAAVVGLAAVFAVKLSTIWSVGAHPLLTPAGDLDDAYFFHLAGRVAAGDVWLLQPESFFGQPAPALFLPPLYIYVLAVALKFGGGLLDAARFVQVVFGTAAVGLIGATSARWFGPLAGWASAALAAGCGLFAFYEQLILPASVDVFLTGLSLWLLSGAMARPAAWRAAALGAALGIHALNRPDLLAVWLVGAVCTAAWASVRRRRTALIGALVAAVATIGIVSPITWRNYRASGSFVPITSTAGLSVLRGNGPDATGVFAKVREFDSSLRGAWLDAPAAASRAIGRPVNPRETSRYLLAASWQWTMENPAAAARLAIVKAWYAVGSGFLAMGHSFPFFARDIGSPLAYLVVGPTLFVPLGLAGFALGLRARERWLVGAYVGGTVAVIVATFTASRYRLPFQAASVVLAGGGLSWLIGRMAARDWRHFIRGAAAVSALALAVAWPTGRDDGRAEERVRMGLHELQQGRRSEGEAWIARAIEAHAAPGVVHLRAAQVLELDGKPADALAHYRLALSAAPEQTALYFAIGRTLVSQGRLEEALPELTRALASPQRDAATRLMVLVLIRLGRQDEANQRVRDLNPEAWSADLAREFALALADAGRVDLSVAAWRRAAEAGGDARDYDRLGLAWVLLDRLPEAIAAFSNAVSRDPRSAPLRLNYAVAFSGVGRHADARREAENALKLDPGYEKAKEFLRSLPTK
jgi:tetratricopeptide (TPR) repeat protein